MIVDIESFEFMITVCLLLSYLTFKSRQAVDLTGTWRWGCSYRKSDVADVTIREQVEHRGKGKLLTKTSSETRGDMMAANSVYREPGWGPTLCFCCRHSQSTETQVEYEISSLSRPRAESVSSTWQRVRELRVLKGNYSNFWNLGCSASFKHLLSAYFF